MNHVFPVYTFHRHSCMAHVFVCWDTRNRDSMDMVYSDETRCLLAPRSGEARHPSPAIVGTPSWSPICVCNLFVHGKRHNLNGAYLDLDYAQQMCGEQYDVLKATQTKNWQWNGPQVTREYPPKGKLIKFSLTVKDSEP